MNRRNLAHLLFSVWSESADEPLCEGPHQAIYNYLKKKKNRAADNLKVTAIDKVNNFSFDPIPADKWLQWWERYALSALIKNDFNNNLMIEYPDTVADLPKL